MKAPDQPKIYHIVHVDRLASIIADQVLWSDSQITARAPSGTTIGMNGIKQRRLTELTLTSHPDLNVGACVPFYLCPRSIMLYMIYQSNHPDLGYKGGQGPIIHLEADLNDSVAWAEANQQRWAFTLSNAGSYYFEDRSDLSRLNEINWTAVEARNWMSCKDGKQAEFLMENCYPWHLVERIGVCSQAIYTQVANVLANAPHRPGLQIKRDWYY